MTHPARRLSDAEGQKRLAALQVTVRGLVSRFRTDLEQEIAQQVASSGFSSADQATAFQALLETARHVLWQNPPEPPAPKPEPVHSGLTDEQRKELQQAEQIIESVQTQTGT